MIISYRGKTPQIDPSVFIAEGAQIIGDVILEEDCSVWFNAVIRGDVNSVRIGKRTNIQDGCLLHVTHQKYPLVIGSNVTIGHGAIVHGAVIQDYCLIGMGARVLDDAHVGPYALVAAGSVVLEHFVVPEGSLVAGVPAKVLRSLRKEERERLTQSAQNYINYVKTYRQ